MKKIFRNRFYEKGSRVFIKKHKRGRPPYLLSLEVQQWLDKYLLENHTLFIKSALYLTH